MRVLEVSVFFSLLPLIFSTIGFMGQRMWSLGDQVGSEYCFIVYRPRLYIIDWIAAAYVKGR